MVPKEKQVWQENILQRRNYEILEFVGEKLQTQNQYCQGKN